MCEQVLIRRRILVIEDEYFTAKIIESIIINAGGEIIGPYSDVDPCIIFESSANIDAAVLDVNVRGGTTFDLADQLMANGVPVIFATGHGKHEIPNKYISAFYLSKPEDLEALPRILASMCA